MPSGLSRAPLTGLVRQLVGVIAVLAPALHTATDIMEWYQHGFSVTQLWLNYLAFVPMPFLLLGLYAVHEREISALGLLGALLYGAAFVYFAHTTLYALADRIPSYEALWARLGLIYTVHGGLMVVGGALFGWAVLRARWLPPLAGQLFLAGIALNLVLAIVPGSNILQTVGSTMRNLGLMAMGYAVLRQRSAGAA